MTDTAQDATASGQGPAGADTKPDDANPPANASSPEPETFAREYVTGLRSEAAQWRTKAQEASKRLQELEDRDKSDAQKAQERAERAEAELNELRADAARREAAEKAGLPSAFASRVQGETPEAMAADARELAKSLKSAGAPPPGSYDNGAGDTGSPGRTDMDALIRGAANR